MIVLNITKIKFGNGEVEIHQESDPNDLEKKAGKIISEDEPLSSFIDSLQALSEDVSDICELQEVSGNISVRGITLTWNREKYDRGFTGAVITALRELEYSRSPMVINTPWLPSYQYNDDNQNPQLDIHTIYRINNLLEQTNLYLNGERKNKQLGLFETVK